MSLKLTKYSKPFNHFKNKLYGNNFNVVCGVLIDGNPVIV